MFKEFKEFIARGSVVDLAVGVIVGGAFNKIVSALTKYILNPFIGLFLGKIDLSSIKFGMFRVGDFLNAVIEFLIISFVVFLIVKTLNALEKPHSQTEPKQPSTDELSAQYLQEIRDLLQQQNHS